MNTDNTARNRIPYLKGEKLGFYFKKKKSLISILREMARTIMPFLEQNARKTRGKLFLEVKVIAKL